MKVVRVLGALLLLSLVASSPAVFACPTDKVLKVLDTLDSAQTNKDPAKLLALFTPSARVLAVSPAKTWERSGAEFVEEKVADDGGTILAYAFMPADVQCRDDGRIVVERRGCQVSTGGNDLYEISQTEVIELEARQDAVLITRMVSTLDAMTANGKKAFEHRPRVEMPQCTEAVKRN